MLDSTCRIVEELLGHRGRMIASTKSGYGAAHPDHVALFNANVCVDGRKVWYGDLDLTRDEPRLRELAARVGEAVHVLYERDARFAHEEEPLLSDAIYWIEPGEEPGFDELLVCRDETGVLHWTRWEATR
jgi:hypothetical protein